MKKRITTILSGILLTLSFIAAIPFPAFASGVGPSTDYMEISVGSSDILYIYGENVAGTISVSTDGCVSAYVNGDPWLEDPVGITVIGNSEGSGNVYVSYEVADFDLEEEYSGSFAVYVEVTGGSDDDGGGTGGNAGGTDYNDDYSIDGGYINGKETGEGSGNCNLSALSVEGYDLMDEGHDVYSVTVGGSVEKIKIIAQTEDEKATVTGDGEQKLEVGENVFDITVTAENGLSKTYTIKVNRRGAKIALTDLIAFLSDKNNGEDVVTVALKEGDLLNADMISAISKWGKTIYLNQYDKDGKIVYGWTLDGKKVGETKDFKEFNPAVSFQSDNIEKINELSNYAAGKILNFAQKGKLPEGTKFKLNIEKDYKDTDKVRLYYFNPGKNELELTAEDLSTGKGIVEFDLAHCSDYLLTRSNIHGAVKEEKNNNNLLFIVIIIIELVIIITLAIILIVVLNKNKKRKKTEEHKETDTVWQKKQ